MANFRFIYDTVCRNEPVNIQNFSPTGLSYQWIFESADISKNSIISEIEEIAIPSGPTPDDRGPYFMASVKEGNNILTFTTKHKAPNGLWRQNFGSTLDNTPDNVFITGESSESIFASEEFEGVEIEKGNDGLWYGFIVSELNRCIYRLHFGADIYNTSPTIEKIFLNNAPTTGHDIELVKEGDLWYGFVSYSRIEGGLLIMKFMDDLGGAPNTIFYDFYIPESLNLPSGYGITGVGVIKNNNTWHVFGSVNHYPHYSLVRMDFSNQLEFIGSENYGSVGGLLNEPRDISIAYDCGYLTGFIINENGTSPNLTVLHFESPTSPNIWGEQIDLSAYISDPRSLSQVYRISGEAMVVVVDRETGELIKIKFSATGSHVNGTPNNNAHTPTGLSYNTEGDYYVSLTLNGDLSTTNCTGVSIVEKPPTPSISGNDICLGDTLYLQSYFNENINYKWTLPDNSTYYGKYPIVTQAGTYKVQQYFGGCFSLESQTSINVLPQPEAEITPTEKLVCENRDFDFSSTVSSGTPPYNQHYWSGGGAAFLNTNTAQDVIYNGSAQPTEDTVFLSDLNWSSGSSGISLPKKDINFYGGKISLNSFPYDKGIAVAGTSSITYILNGEYKKFISEFAMDNSSERCGSMLFQIFTDGTLRYTSGSMQYFTPKDFAQIPLNNVNELRITTSGGTSPDSCTIGAWGNARLIKDSEAIYQNLFYTVTDNQGCQGFDTAVITLDTSTVKALVPGWDSLACQGVPLTFVTAASGKGNISYQWQKLNNSSWIDLPNGNEYSGTDSFSMTIDSLQFKHVGRYRCFFTSDDCGVGTSKEYIVINNSPPYIISTTPNHSCGIEAVEISALPSKGTINWYSSDTSSNILFTGDSYTHPLIFENDTIWAEANNGGCLGLSRTAVPIEYIPRIPIDSFSIKPATDCMLNDGELYFHVNGNHLDYEYSIDGTTWSNDTSYSGLSAIFYTPMTRYPDEICTFSEIPVQVTSINSPVFDSVSYQSVTDCGLDDGYIKIYMQPGIYIFSLNGSLIQNTGIYDPIDEGNYQITVSNDDGSCPTPWHSEINIIRPVWPVIDTIEITQPPNCRTTEGKIIVQATAPSELQYLLWPGNTWQNNGSFTNLTAGQYSISVKYPNNTCIVNENKKIVLSLPPEPILDSVAYTLNSSCKLPNASIELFGTNGIAPYHYFINGDSSLTDNNKVSGLQEGDYTLWISNKDNSCSSIPSVIHIVKECKDSIFTAICNTEGEYNLKNEIDFFIQDLEWYDTDMNPMESLIHQEDFEMGRYEFRAISGNDSIRVFLDVTQAGDAGTTSWYATCHPYTTTRALNLPFINNPRLEMKYQNNIISPNDSIELYPGENDLYVYIPATKLCSADSAEVIIHLDNTPPYIDCPYDPLILNLEAGFKEVVLHNDTLNPTIDDDCSYTYFNDYTNTNSLAGAIFKAGNHDIIWTATDESGNSNECYIEIKVRDFEIPNIFTPNGDDNNEYWEFDIEKAYPNAIILIYNRWGKLVHTTSAKEEIKWDGYIDNQPAPIDGYFYTIVNEGKVIFKGDITVYYD